LLVARASTHRLPSASAVGVRQIRRSFNYRNHLSLRHLERNGSPAAAGSNRPDWPTKLTRHANPARFGPFQKANSLTNLVFAYQRLLFQGLTYFSTNLRQGQPLL